MDRQKLLLLLLVVVAVGYGGDWAYRTWIEEPFRLQESVQTKAEKTQSDIHDRTIRAKTLVRELPGFEDRSLPANSLMARQAYQAWCWQWIKRHDIANPTVEVSEPRPRSLTKTNKKDQVPDMHEIGVTIRGVAALQVVVDLLADFHETKFLHRIDALSLTPVNQGRQLSITISVSALSLKTATQTDRLPGQSTGNVNLVQDEQASSELNAASVNAEPNTLINANIPAVANSETSRDDIAEASPPANLNDSVATNPPVVVEPAPPTAEVIERPWHEVVRRNMFAAGGGMTIAKAVKLSAITEDIKGVKQAWFRNTQQGPTQVVDLGQTFNQGALSAQVMELNDEHAILQIDGDQVRVQIGQVIADGVALVRAGKL
ncbi:MAG: hypothetical protein Q8M16_24570 [Pirellulaceae bacterium]|nr:hypothetical protein [Pirellulaceae bacterium]